MFKLRAFATSDCNKHDGQNDHEGIFAAVVGRSQAFDERQSHHSTSFFGKGPVTQVLSVALLQAFPVGLK